MDKKLIIIVIIIIAIFISIVVSSNIDKHEDNKVINNNEYEESSRKELSSYSQEVLFEDESVAYKFYDYKLSENGNNIIVSFKIKNTLNVKKEAQKWTIKFCNNEGKILYKHDLMIKDMKSNEIIEEKFEAGTEIMEYSIISIEPNEMQNVFSVEE